VAFIALIFHLATLPKALNNQADQTGFSLFRHLSALLFWTLLLLIQFTVQRFPRVIWACITVAGLLLVAKGLSALFVETDRIIAGIVLVLLGVGVLLFGGSALRSLSGTVKQ